MERIFIDKLFAAEAYVRSSSLGHKAFEAAKHIYDLAVIAEHPKIEKLLSDSNKLQQLLEIRLEEEQGRLDGIPDVYPTEFTFFTHIREMIMFVRPMIPCRANMCCLIKTESNLNQPPKLC